MNLSHLGPSAPTITNVTAVSSTSLYVQWEKPETWYNNIDNYIIRYRTKSGETSEEKQVGGEVHDVSTPKIREAFPRK